MMRNVQYCANINHITANANQMTNMTPLCLFSVWWQTQTTLLSWTSLLALLPPTPSSLTDPSLRYNHWTKQLHHIVHWKLLLRLTNVFWIWNELHKIYHCLLGFTSTPMLLARTPCWLLAFRPETTPEWFSAALWTFSATPSSTLLCRRPRLAPRGNLHCLLHPSKRVIKESLVTFLPCELCCSVMLESLEMLTAKCAS